MLWGSIGCRQLGNRHTHSVADDMHTRNTRTHTHTHSDTHTQLHGEDNRHRRQRHCATITNANWSVNQEMIIIIRMGSVRDASGRFNTLYAKKTMQPGHSIILLLGLTALARQCRNDNYIRSNVHTTHKWPKLIFLYFQKTGSARWTNAQKQNNNLLMGHGPLINSITLTHHAFIHITICNSCTIEHNSVDKKKSQITILPSRSHFSSVFRTRNKKKFLDVETIERLWGLTLS